MNWYWVDLQTVWASPFIQLDSPRLHRERLMSKSASYLTWLAVLVYLCLASAWWVQYDNGEFSCHDLQFSDCLDLKSFVHEIPGLQMKQWLFVCSCNIDIHGNSRINTMVSQAQLELRTCWRRQGQFVQKMICEAERENLTLIMACLTS